MAASPPFKLYKFGKYLGSLKTLEDCAMMIACWEEGEIRYGHTEVLWREHWEKQYASESYDFVVQTCIERMQP